MRQYVTFLLCMCVCMLNAEECCIAYILNLYINVLRILLQVINQDRNVNRIFYDLMCFKREW